MILFRGVHRGVGVTQTASIKFGEGGNLWSKYLAVTSGSAERAMSRVKIIKNRLRSAMGPHGFQTLWF